LETIKPTPNGPRRERSPLSLDRDSEAQTAYFVISLAILFLLLLGARLQWAVAWCMTTLCVFVAWRFGRGQFNRS
jgi:hypothetical protein